MDDQCKTMEQLRGELAELRQRITQLEKGEQQYERADKALHESEVRYRNMIEGSYDLIQSVRVDGTFEFVNHAWLDTLAYTEEEVPTLNLFDDIIDPDSLTHCQEIFSRIMAGESVENIEAVFLAKDGRRILVEGHVTPRLLDGEVIATHAFFRDITERKRAEAAVRKATRALKTLSSCNQVMIRAKEEAELLQDMCRTIVEVGGYRLAWVGFAGEDARKTVRPVAQMGYEEGYLATLNITWSDNKRGRGPTGTAIRTGKPSICNSMLTDPKFSPWRAEALKRGYASSIALPLIAEGRPFGALNIYALEPDAFDAEEVRLLTELASDLAFGIVAVRLRAERKGAEEELQHTLEKLRKALGGIIQAVTLTVEARDPYTAGHQRRTTNLARAIATEMGLSEEQIDGIRMAGAIHDLGKISVPAEILNKPGRLTENEFAIIQAHAQVGYDILKMIEFPWPIAQIALQHHERMNGSGYPEGLKGDEIMLEARILGVADVIEAMSSHRPYRPALGLDKALQEISQNRGILYDANAVDASLRLFTEKGFKLE